MDMHHEASLLRVASPVMQSAAAIFRTQPNMRVPHRIGRHDGRWVIEEHTSRGWLRLSGEYDTPGFAWQELNSYDPGGGRQR